MYYPLLKFPVALFYSANWYRAVCRIHNPYPANYSSNSVLKTEYCLNNPEFCFDNFPNRLRKHFLPSLINGRPPALLHLIPAADLLLTCVVLFAHRVSFVATFLKPGVSFFLSGLLSRPHE